MIRKQTSFCILAVCLCAIFAQSYAQSCPSHIKKDALVGTQSSLPEGWFVYAIQGKPGVHKSPLKNFKPVVVPGTETDNPINLSISDDGQWVSYTIGEGTTGKLFLIRADGSSKTEVPAKPVDAERFRFLRRSGFYRKSPMGSELFYMKSNYVLGAIQVTLSGSKPTFGSDRVILDLSKGGECFKYESYMSFGAGQTQVSGNHIVSRVRDITWWITIPDQGKGIATRCQRLQLKGSIGNGCGESISHDGTMTCSNPGKYSESLKDCIPMSWNDMDHKGPIIVPFVENSVTDLTNDDLVMKQGKSVNWCPQKYRFGTSQEMEFHHWQFTNDKQYILCSQLGSKAPDPGCWILHWQSNTWTRLAPGSSEIHLRPAAYILNPTSVQKPQSGRSGPVTHRIAHTNNQAGYSLQGRIFKPTASKPVQRRSPGIYLIGSGTSIRKALLNKKAF